MYVPSTGPIMPGPYCDGELSAEAMPISRSSPYMTQEPGAISSFAQPVMSPGFDLKLWSFAEQPVSRLRSQPYFLQEPTSKTAVPAAFQDPGVPVPLPTALAAAPQGRISGAFLLTCLHAITMSVKKAI